MRLSRLAPEVTGVDGGYDSQAREAALARSGPEDAMGLTPGVLDEEVAGEGIRATTSRQRR